MKKLFVHVEGNLYQLCERGVTRKDLATQKWMLGVDAERGYSPDSEKALQYYREALRHDSSLLAAWINMGTIYYNRGAWKRARRCYERATKRDPQYALAWFDLGNVFDELHRPQLSIDCYKTAVAINPCYADAYFNLALVYENIKDRNKALGCFRMYLQLTSGSDPWAERARQEISGLKASGPQIVRKLSASGAFNDRGIPLIIER